MRTSCRILISGFLFIMIIPVFGQRLKGKVKSYTLRYYSVYEKFGEIKKGPHLEDPRFHDEVVSFDQNGNFTQSVEFNSNGTVYAKFKGKYDYVNNNIESIYVSFDPEITFERKPFILGSVRYSWGELCKITYKINFKGQPVEETIYDLMDHEICKISIVRDEYGNSLEDNYSDGTVDKYKYDHDGNRTEWTSISHSGNTTIMSFQYDASGNMTENNINNFFKSTYKFHYDVFTYSYLFDKKGNWTERRESENGKPLRLVVRTIEYAW